MTRAEMQAFPRKADPSERKNTLSQGETPNNEVNKE